MNHESVKHVGDFTAGVTTIGTLAGLLPAIAALFSIIWTALRIIEMITGKTISELLKK